MGSPDRVCTHTYRTFPTIEQWGVLKQIYSISGSVEGGFTFSEERRRRSMDC